MMNIKHSLYVGSLAGAMLALSVAHGATVAYWDFETGSSGAPVNGQELVDNAALDSANGYYIECLDAGTGMNYTNQTIDGSSFSLHANGSEEGYTTDNTFNNFGSTAWTIEVAVRLDNLGGWHTVIGKNGYSVGADTALSDFYLQNSGLDDSWRLSFRTVSGETCVIDASGVDTVAGKWYGLAAVSDGTNAYLYVDSRDGTGYNLEASYAYTNAVVSSNALPSTSLNWTFMRGWFNGGSVDYCDGYIDNVRFSDTALDPSSLLPLPLDPFVSIVGSPTDSTSSSTRTLEAVIVDGDSEFSSAVLSLDGSPVATNNTPSGTTNTVSYLATGLSVGIHTGKVVVVGINPAATITNEWTFGVLSDAPQDGVVSWNWDNNGTVSGSNVAGVVAVSNWVNSWPAYQTVNLEDNTGVVTPIDIAWASFNDYRIQASHPGQDTDGSYNREMLNGYLNAGPAGWNPPTTESSVTLSDIHYTSYDIIVYFSSDVAGREGYVTDGTTTNYFNTVGPASITDLSGNALLVQTSDTTTNGYTNAANYAVFSDLTGASQTVTVQMRDNDEWGGIAAVQIVGKGSVAPPSNPDIQSIAISGGMATLIWNSDSGVNYTIQSKPALDAVSWTDKQAKASDGDGTTTDTVTISANEEFYRIKAE